MKKIISSLLASAIILTVSTSCMSKPSDEVTTSDESSQENQVTSSKESSQENEKKIENALAEFIKKPEVIDIIASNERGMGPPTISLLDMTGDNIPEILFSRLYIDGMMNVNFGPNEATQVYDIDTLEEIGSFQGGILRGDMKKIQTESGGKFVVFFDQYISGRQDTLVSEITILPNKIDVEYKFAFICEREDPYNIRYHIYDELTEEEGIAVYRHWTYPSINDFENWEGVPVCVYTEYLCNLEFIDYQLLWSAYCELDENGVVQLEEKKDAKPKDN